MLKKNFISTYFVFIYEIAQLMLFLLLKIINLVIKNKKLNKFLSLRSPIKFYHSINIAKENYKNLPGATSIGGQRIIYWFHVSSAGEMEQAIPVARKLHEKLGVYFFVTYYSFSAEPFLKYFPAAIGFAGLPLDIRYLYKKLLAVLPITKIFFVRYDIWPSLLTACKEEKLEINLLSATKIKTKKGFQAFISKKWNNLFYKYFNHIFAVSQDDLIYFKNIHPNGHVYLAGDAKWARANERAHSSDKTNNDINFSIFIQQCKTIKETQNKKILVIGSPHTEEHTLVLNLSVLKEKFFIIYVPHEVEAKSIQTLFSTLTNKGYNSTTYSTLTSNINSQEFTRISHDKSTNYDLIIIDRVGFLAEIYQVADAAIIGGGFDGQIHNVLEAAARGVPTLFGPSYERAREATELVQSEAAISFENLNNMFHFLSVWVNFEVEPLNSRETETRLKHTRQNALQLFQNLPDTSEVIFNALK